MFIGILPVARLTAQSLSSLQQGFQQPPPTARPQVFWHWMNGNISKEGIRKDLLDMQRCGIGGVFVFNVAQDVPPGPVRYGTPLWYEHMAYALRLCDSLGISLINTNCPGWSTSGGPWIDVARSMKVLTWSEQEVRGGRRQRISLPMPAAKLSYYHEIAVVAVPSDKSNEIDLRGLGTICYSDKTQTLPLELLTDGDEQTGVTIPLSDARDYIEINFAQPVTTSLLTLYMGSGAWLYHFDGRITWSADGKIYRPLRDFQYQGYIMHTAMTIPFEAVTARSFRVYVKTAYRTTAIATDIREIALSHTQRVENKDAQIGRTFANIHRVANRPASLSTPATAIDLTDKVDSLGVLDWEAPAGNWTILRMGYTVSGTTNHPAPPEATGLEVDKLDAAAVAYHFNQMHAPMQKLVREQGLTSWKGIAIDSYEAGVQNWSAGLLQAFREQHGYDLRPWLPVLTGRVLGSQESSNAVLHDYRQTVSSLLARNFYGTTKILANEQGLQLYVEPYGGFFDTYRNTGFADVTLGEFWMSFGTNNIRQIASAVHTKGQTIVGAEAFTAVPQYGAFQDMPAYIKRLGDRAFLDGLNLNVLHSYVHQPADAGPGFTLGRFGSHFGRLNTWWRQAPAWIDYLSRVQFMLQQGQFVADICVLKNDEIDFVADQPGSDTARLAYTGYNYDYCAHDDILNMRMQDGRLVLPHGQSYRMLLLPPNRFMRLPVLKHLETLIRQGLIVAGKPPLSPPGMVSAANLAEYNRLVKTIWNGSGRYGAGKVYTTSDPLAVFKSNKVLPDMLVKEADSVQCVHRRTSEADIYFLSNQQGKEVWAEVTLAAAGVPQLWDPVTGKICAIDRYYQAGGHTSFRLMLAPYAATCVVLAKRAPVVTAVTGSHDDSLTKSDRGHRVASLAALLQPPPLPVVTLPLTGSWLLRFLDGRGAPDSLRIDSLQLWNEFTNPGIRYYSGTVAYARSFTLLYPVRSLGLWRLQLDQVYDIAAIRINGKEVATLWTAPYVADITNYVQPGENKLEILVTNRWINRLIGDQQPGVIPSTVVSYQHYTADSPLVPAGLAGPISILGYK
ncbi:glycosyl hydrolase [Paraflavitalea pollutisoli]|uniref:glycosyl hydrolase n=1 Tax=Paraflavitalea pollutisoli TaxID=3034143 RepID=UPI0023EB069F|nr:glycosyl hydrolase [Paraflavitalea sp. H1-2-19X]